MPCRVPRLFENFGHAQNVVDLGVALKAVAENCQLVRISLVIFSPVQIEKVPIVELEPLSLKIDSLHSPKEEGRNGLEVGV